MHSNVCLQRGTQYLRSVYYHMLLQHAAVAQGPSVQDAAAHNEQARAIYNKQLAVAANSQAGSDAECMCWTRLTPAYQSILRASEFQDFLSGLQKLTVRPCMPFIASASLLK